MLFRTLTLRHFRNVDLARLEFMGKRQFFVGRNGQGKTNLLEAAGFVTALRSFRTTESAALRQLGEPTAALSCEIEHERLGSTRVVIKLHERSRELSCDGERIQRLADYLGRFPTVVFSSPDLQLVRGAPAGRRRWLDLTLAAMDPAYLHALQQYATALQARNQLLKRGAGSDAEFDAFEEPLARFGAALVRIRSAGLAEIGVETVRAYARLAEGADHPEILYAPNNPETSIDARRERLRSDRGRDRQFRSTLVGPHRDDFSFRLGGNEAREFGSEGQQRSLALALRLAQCAWFQARSGIRPVILADDVLGELDRERRRRFWATLDPEAQVLATGTQPPDAELGPWQIFSVTAGRFEPQRSTEAAS